MCSEIAQLIATVPGIQLTVLGDSPLLPPTLPPEGFKGTGRSNVDASPGPTHTHKIFMRCNRIPLNPNKFACQRK